MLPSVTTKDEEDRRDVERVLDGDINAFAGIVARWQSPLVNLGWRYFRDRGRAEEMAQEAFLRAFKSLRTWRGDSAFSTWLFALAANLYRTELRRIPFPAISLDWPGANPNTIHEPRDPHDLAEDFAARSRNQAIRRAVHTLPPRYRDVLLLFYFHEMDVAATAQTLRLPEGTVKARLARGRDQLRNKLRPMLPTGQLQESL